MGTFTVTIQVGGLAGQQFIEGEARLQLDGRQLTAVVVFAPEGTGAVVGATTLENFGLRVDPVGHRLIPVPGLLKEV